MSKNYEKNYARHLKNVNLVIEIKSITKTTDITKFKNEIFSRVPQ